jgi:hypothetical protein
LRLTANMPAVLFPDQRAGYARRVRIIGLVVAAVSGLWLNGRVDKANRGARQGEVLVIELPDSDVNWTEH